MSPKVTVVIAAYNAETFIRETIESVLVQSLPSMELIVVDDGSTDGTQRVLSSFTDHRLTVFCQENRGVSAARNVGLAAARAPYIFFLVPMISCSKMRFAEWSTLWIRSANASPALGIISRLRKTIRCCRRTLIFH